MRLYICSNKIVHDLHLNNYNFKVVNNDDYYFIIENSIIALIMSIIWKLKDHFILKHTFFIFFFFSFPSYHSLFVIFFYPFVFSIYFSFFKFESFYDIYSANNFFAMEEDCLTQSSS